MNNLEFSIKQLTAHNQDGSQATRANRHRGLMAIAGELHGLGFKLKSAPSSPTKGTTSSSRRAGARAAALA